MINDGDGFLGYGVLFLLSFMPCKGRPAPVLVMFCIKSMKVAFLQLYLLLSVSIFLYCFGNGRVLYSKEKYTGIRFLTSSDPNASL